MREDFKIDFVYLWVDGNDEKWQQEKEEWQIRLNMPLTNATNNCRYIDNQELRYSLRSVEMNAPWINKIFIVTNGQIPEWLDVSHPKIRLVTHKEIMPADALPTFNSEAIESCITNIPGLSEHFLYACDDMFINGPVTPDFFFDQDGEPIIRMVEHNWTEEQIEKSLFLKNVTHSMHVIKGKYDKEYKFEAIHNIDAYRKSYIQACQKEFREEYDKVCRCKFRKEYSIERTSYAYWALANNLGKFVCCKNKVSEDTTPLDVLYMAMVSPKKMKERISTYNPKLLCINDGENVNPENRRRLKNFLSELYPQRQAWEKVIDFQIDPIFDTHNCKTIVFAPDNNYCKYFSSALQSLIDNSKDYEDYDIILLATDITERNKNILLNMLPPNFSLRIFDISDFINEKLANIHLGIREYWSVSMYYRIFIPMIMQKYEKVLYCDSDITITDSLNELFETNFDDKEILAVVDTVSPVLNLTKTRNSHLKNKLKLKNPENYFNSGMIMFNIPKINLEDYIGKFYKALETEILLFPDQDILNIIFEGKVKLVSCKWNYQYHKTIFDKNYENIIYVEYKKDFLEARKAPKIIHYTSSRKPWHSPGEEMAEQFWRYARRGPFYEEILYKHLKGGGIQEDTLKNINMKWKIYFNYYRTKLLSFVTIGKTKKHYLEKRDRFKQRVRDIRKFSHL